MKLILTEDDGTVRMMRYIADDYVKFYHSENGDDGKLKIERMIENELPVWDDEEDYLAYSALP